MSYEENEVFLNTDNNNVNTFDDDVIELLQAQRLYRRMLDDRSNACKIINSNHNEIINHLSEDSNSRLCAFFPPSKSLALKKNVFRCTSALRKTSADITTSISSAPSLI
uniref:Uncharacterized protein n=1 Tax=Glossina brevipalpis TaxID=37001 RepID=A0A1A9W3U6_9MUSC